MKVATLKIPVSKSDFPFVLKAEPTQAGARNAPAGQSAARPLQPPADYLLLLDGQSWQGVRRLVVLVPAAQLDDHAYALRVWQMQTPQIHEVLFVGLAEDHASDSLMLRRMAELGSAVRGEHARIVSRLLYAQDWQTALGEVLQPADLVVCLEAHLAYGGRFHKVSLAQVVVSLHAVPVYVIRGIELKRTIAWREPLRAALFWVAALAIIGLFMLIQIQIQINLQGWLAGCLEVVSIFCEVFVLWRISAIR